jgi:hypothetical protein
MVQGNGVVVGGSSETGPLGLEFRAREGVVCYVWAALVVMAVSSLIVGSGCHCQRSLVVGHRYVPKRNKTDWLDKEKNKKIKNLTSWQEGNGVVVHGGSENWPPSVSRFERGRG